MAKPRIIIADTDAGYIIPLQLKFAEDFLKKLIWKSLPTQTILKPCFLLHRRLTF